MADIGQSADAADEVDELCCEGLHIVRFSLAAGPLVLYYSAALWRQDVGRFRGRRVRLLFATAHNHLATNSKSGILSQLTSTSRTCCVRSLWDLTIIFPGRIQKFPLPSILGNADGPRTDPVSGAGDLSGVAQTSSTWRLSCVVTHRNSSSCASSSRFELNGRRRLVECIHRSGRQTPSPEGGSTARRIPADVIPWRWRSSVLSFSKDITTVRHFSRRRANA